MTLVARRRAAVLVPWLALAAVTAFALVQMRARRQAERGEPAVAIETPAPAVSTPQPAGVDVTAAAHVAEAALDVALQDLATTRAEAGRLAREGSAATARAEAAGARLAAHAARVEALERELATLRAAAAERAAEPPVEPTVETVAPPAGSTDETRGWAENAGSADLRVRQSATEKAAAASPEQIARLELIRAAGGDLLALARLAAVLPTGEATDVLVVGLLLDGRVDVGLAGRLGTALGSKPLLRPAVLEALLGRATPGVLKVALGWLTAHEADLGDEARRTELAQALTPRFESAEMSQVHAASRAAGLLRLPGTASRLAALLDHEAVIVRVVAAHALSLVPDLDTVRAEAEKALPKLLLDDALSVRTAGALLADALVGAPVAYDPSAGEGARRAALDAILDRLN